MTRLPIRARLTAAFAAATVLVLVGAGLFVYLRLRADIDDSIDASLDSRLLSAENLVRSTGALAGYPLEDPEESFVQLIDEHGAVIDEVGLARRPALSAGAVAAGATLTAEAEVPGIDGTARIRARSVADGRVLVVGQSLVNRSEALNDLLLSFLIGGPVSVLAASLAGYALARRGFAPVERMRSSAAALSLSSAGGRLPVPNTGDEIHRLAETLNDMIGRLEASLARERRFVADASHELRTPIAVIKTELETALASGGGPDTAEGLRAAIDECDSLALLADDLLTLSRAGEAGLALSVTPTTVHALLDEARNRFADRVAAHGRAILIEVDANLGPPTEVEVDPLRMRQAVSNLIDNAVRHGTGTIVLRARASGGNLLLEASDDGPGFSAEIAIHAFERFARGDRARSHRGAGLGLGIVKTIAEAHGGTATVVATAPTTTVQISVPLRS